MKLKQTNNEIKKQERFIEGGKKTLQELSSYTDYITCDLLENTLSTLQANMERFQRDDLCLNIGVIGQVKAGKSTFLNTLLFDGNKVLPSAKTPKTATLTRIEYAEENQVKIEYYTEAEWSQLEMKAQKPDGGISSEAAREIMGMVRERGVDPTPYISKGEETFSFASSEELMRELNGYVGEDGTYTPFVKNVTIYLNDPKLHGISVTDTPGLNDAITSRTDKTREFLSKCDVVFFLSRASQFLDQTDMDLLQNQLPQNGVGEMILLCSRFDEGIMDELRRYKTLRSTKAAITEKLTKKAEEIFDRQKQKFGDARWKTFMEQCRTPIFLATLPAAMSKKSPEQYDKVEAFIQTRFEKYEPVTQELLAEIGNIEEVNQRFQTVVEHKDNNLKEKMQRLLPEAESQWRQRCTDLIQIAKEKKNILETKDQVGIQKQQRQMQSQISGIQASVTAVLGDAIQKLEQVKGETLRDLREARRKYSQITTHQRSETRHRDVTTYDHHFLCFKWGKRTESVPYTTTYSCLETADALENIRSFGDDACSDIENAFYRAIKPTEIKKLLLKTILENMDTSDENFDINSFRLMAEKTLNALKFPEMKLDTSAFVSRVSSRFSGEVRNSTARARLTELLSQTIGEMLENVTEQFSFHTNEFQNSLVKMQENFEGELLRNIQHEFDALKIQFEDKAKSIKKYEEVLSILSKNGLSE